MGIEPAPIPRKTGDPVLDREIYKLYRQHLLESMPFPRKRRKIKIRYTCCNVCHGEHYARWTAFFHWCWLKLIGAA